MFIELWACPRAVCSYKYWIFRNYLHIIDSLATFLKIQYELFSEICVLLKIQPRFLSCFLLAKLGIKNYVQWIDKGQISQVTLSSMGTRTNAKVLGQGLGRRGCGRRCVTEVIFMYIFMREKLANRRSLRWGSESLSWRRAAVCEKEEERECRRAWSIVKI